MIPVNSPAKSRKDTTQKWETQENAVTHNDVIDAFLTGKEVGRSEQLSVNLRLFGENYEKAKSLSETLHKQLESMGFKVVGLHLRADSITSFNTLLIVDKMDYLNESFLKSFSIARAFKNDADSDTFNIAFTFTPDSDTLDENCLEHDGFFAKYKK
ncbi:hypothetical protein [Flavisolibacter nicotianae]|uniref:hypothetical protein n=1 Tax=Flavisolibacter nicotianae TaxID=2364882 RepID=UPI0013C4EC3A|nr:hypothetical protein [Flavisolibacter nicotianae]